MTFPAKGILYEINLMMHGQGVNTLGYRMPCGDIELNAMECLEAYGAVKGQQRCKDFLDDLHECRHQGLRKMRWYAMRLERNKQVITGQRSLANKEGPKYAYDAFYETAFSP